MTQPNIGKVLVTSAAMLPRQVVPRQFYLVTRRCTQDFVEDYVVAREAWRAGARVAFPPGTYWLHRHARVLIAAT